MLPENIRQIVICAHRVDFRKRWNGLLGECERLGYDPYVGDFVVFVKRDRRQLLAIAGDDRGLYLFSRRFEGGSLSFLFDDSCREISRAELALWFEGARYTVHSKAKPWRGKKY